MNRQFETREKLIKRYFDIWLKKQAPDFHSIFDKDIEYSECYGPVYKGIDQIEKWFSDWHTKGSILSWNIKNFIHQNNFSAVEWDFSCQYEDNTDNFDGVTLVEFNNEKKIIFLKEFQSKSQHYYPYD